MRERRTEIRNMCSDMVEASWKDADGVARRATAVLEDISPSGACLQLETPVPERTLIRWEASGQQYAGVVRYCAFQRIGYFVGVEFDAGCKWSKTEYTPRHLLELDKLIPKTPSE